MASIAAATKAVTKTAKAAAKNPGRPDNRSYPGGRINRGDSFSSLISNGRNASPTSFREGRFNTFMDVQRTLGGGRRDSSDSGSSRGTYNSDVYSMPSDSSINSTRWNEENDNIFRTNNMAFGFSEHRESPTQPGPRYSALRYSTTRDTGTAISRVAPGISRAIPVHSPRQSPAPPNSSGANAARRSSSSSTSIGTLGSFGRGVAARSTNPNTISQPANRVQRAYNANIRSGSHANTQTQTTSGNGPDKNGLKSKAISSAGIVGGAAVHSTVSGLTGMATAKYVTDQTLAFKQNNINRAVGYMEKHGIPFIPGGAGSQPSTKQHTSGSNYIESPHGVNPYTYNNAGAISNSYGVGTF